VIGGKVVGPVEAAPEVDGLVDDGFAIGLGFGF
jgi:hypothetical protein